MSDPTTDVQPPATIFPVTPTSPPAVTRGWKTSEFWCALAAMLVTALYASGVVPTTGTWAAVVAMVATVLTALGYTVSRTLIKK